MKMFAFFLRFQDNFRLRFGSRFKSISINLVMVTKLADGIVTVTIPPDVTQQPMTNSNVMTTTDPYLTPICNAVVNTVCGDDDNKLCATDGNTYQN